MKKKRSLWSLIIWAGCTVSTLSAWASLQSTGNPATTQTRVRAKCNRLAASTLLLTNSSMETDSVA